MNIVSRWDSTKILLTLSIDSLRDANLRGANLRDANLRGANLRGADLRGADLDKTKGVARMTTLLCQEVGFAYKVTSMQGQSPTWTPLLEYVVGKAVTAELSSDRRVECGAGINLADLDYVAKNYSDDVRLFLCSFNTAPENVCIPYQSDGKFRVGECVVERELDFEATLLAGRPVDKAAE